MNRFLLTGMTIIFTTIVVGCSKNEITELKTQNTLLQEKLNQIEQEQINQETIMITDKIQNTENNIKPDKVKITVSWIGGALSTQTSAMGEVYYGNESYNINSEESAKEFVTYGFTRGGMLSVGCNEGYNMIQCKPFSNTDSVQIDDYGCFLGNEDPDLIRTSIIIECSKI